LFRIAFDERLEADTQSAQAHVALAAQDLEIVQPLRRQMTGADDDAVDRAALDEDCERRVSAQHRVALHPNPRLARVVVDEADEPGVAAAFGEQFSNDETAARAGAVDDHAAPRSALTLEKLAD